MRSLVPAVKAERVPAYGPVVVSWSWWKEGSDADESSVSIDGVVNDGHTKAEVLPVVDKPEVALQGNVGVFDSS